MTFGGKGKEASEGVLRIVVHLIDSSGSVGVRKGEGILFSVLATPTPPQRRSIILEDADDVGNTCGLSLTARRVLS